MFVQTWQQTLQALQLQQVLQQQGKSSLTPIFTLAVQNLNLSQQDQNSIRSLFSFYSGKFVVAILCHMLVLLPSMTPLTSIACTCTGLKCKFGK